MSKFISADEIRELAGSRNRNFVNEMMTKWGMPRPVMTTAAAKTSNRLWNRLEIERWLAGKRETQHRDKPAPALGLDLGLALFFIQGRFDRRALQTEHLKRMRRARQNGARPMYAIRTQGDLG